MDNNTISLQELLDSISRLREDVNTLTVAFSYLAFSIPREQMQSTLASIQFESCNPKWSRNNKTLSGGLLYYWMKNMLVKLPFRRTLQRTRNYSR